MSAVQEIMDGYYKQIQEIRKLKAEKAELLKALQLICAGAPDVYPERYEGDNHGDTAFCASEQTHFSLAYIARESIKNVTGEAK